MNLKLRMERLRLEQTGLHGVCTVAGLTLPKYTGPDDTAQSMYLLKRTVVMIRMCDAYKQNEDDLRFVHASAGTIGLHRAVSPDVCTAEEPESGKTEPANEVLCVWPRSDS